MPINEQLFKYFMLIIVIEAIARCIKQFVLNVRNRHIINTPCIQQLYHQAVFLLLVTVDQRV